METILDIIDIAIDDSADESTESDLNEILQKWTTFTEKLKKSFEEKAQALREEYDEEI